MKPEQVLQSDVLDIIFYNRNKLYGAYELRRQYNKRLAKALSVVLLIVLLVYVLEQVKASKDDTLAGVPVIDVDIRPTEPVQPKPKEQPKAIKHKLAQVHSVVPQIVKDHLADKKVPTVDDQANKIISNIDKPGDTLSSDMYEPPAERPGSSVEKEPTVEEPEKQPEVNTPLMHAQVMPEFPGGKDAFLKYMHRHLKEPELEPGEKIVVRVQFIVDAEGNISEAVILQSGGVLDQEVLRVVKKMPKWNPGKQNGKAVAVYFQLPVTFINREE